MSWLYTAIWPLAWWSTTACYVGMALAEMAWPHVRIRSRYPLCKGTPHPPIYHWQGRVA